MTDKTKWSYLAGLFDGEGSITICRRSGFDKRVGRSYPAFIFTIQITNTNLTLMKWLITNFGGVYYSANATRPEHWKPSYQWRVKGRKNEEQMLLSVLPYLVIKREQALLGLEYVRMLDVKDPVKREELMLRLRELNRRGKSVETNTLGSEMEKIESVLVGDDESAPVVTQAA